MKMQGTYLSDSWAYGERQDALITVSSWRCMEDADGVVNNTQVNKLHTKSQLFMNIHLYVCS